MESISKEQIAILLDYQNIEIEADNINAVLSSLPEKIDALDHKLSIVEQEIKEKEEALEALKKVYREDESDVQMNLSLAQKSDEKLMAVKTNKEYQATLKEIEKLKLANSKIEDKMLENLDRIEESEKGIEEKRRAFSKLKDEIQVEKSVIEQTTVDKKGELANLDERKMIVSAKIEPELLDRYSKLRNQLNGAAVAVVRDAVCYGCHMNIPPQMYNELHQTDTLKFCPHCYRILYVNDSEESQETDNNE